MRTEVPNEPAERELVRLVTGELDRDSAEALTLRIAKDEVLEARKREITTTWQKLELPPVAPVPLGFSDRVVAIAAESSQLPLAWGATPGWVRGIAALSLALGLALGLWAGFAGGALPASPAEVDLLGLASDPFAGIEEGAL